MIIDTHCHFDMMDCPEQYIDNIENKGDIVIGMTNLPSHFDMGINHVKGYRHVRLALGFHPHFASEHQNELSLFRNYIDSTSYVGEIGLDYSNEYIATKDAQIVNLRSILSILKHKKKIISVHSIGAETELFELLQEYGIKNVIFHWYSGKLSLIESIVKEGYFFSINEKMTLSKVGMNIISRIPKERILTETDSPFNNKANIRTALRNIGMSEQEVYTNFKSILSKIS